jgi:hypothetical protein
VERTGAWGFMSPTKMDAHQSGQAHGPAKHGMEKFGNCDKIKDTSYRMKISANSI